MERTNTQRIENQDVNQKLNAYIHSKLKDEIGLRNYLRYIKTVAFSAMEKHVFAVICENHEKLEELHEKYNMQIGKIVAQTWHSSKIEIKYYYSNSTDTDNVPNLVEVDFNSAFVETPNNEVIYFNDTTNSQTFENFVICEDNITASEVCKSVVCYTDNELVNEGAVIHLQGQTSSGKSHLLSAMKAYYQQMGGKICLITASNFLRQYVSSVQQKRGFAFYDELLENDIIAIDNIDDLLGKNGTLHALKQLVGLAIENNKFVVLSSRLTSAELSEKNSHLKNILSSALSLSLGEHNNEVKSKILMNYITEKNMNVPISIVRELTEKLDGNVREMKNYIKKLSIVKSVRKFELNSSLAMEILAEGHEMQTSRKQISNEEIVKVVNNYYKLPENVLLSKIKSANVCRARNVAMHLMRTVNNANFQEIGRCLNRTHATVIAGLKNIQVMLENDKKLPGEVAELKSKINP